MRTLELKGMACILCAGFLSLFATSCSDQTQVQLLNEVSTSHLQPFTLTASRGEADTKLQFKEGTTTNELEWNDGDKLYLVNADNENAAVITMTTTLSEPASTATFVSKEGVPAGTYHVMYGEYKSDYYLTYPDHINTIRNGYYTAPNGLYNDNDLCKNMAMAGTLTVTDGQTSGTISLQHLYAKIKFTLDDTSGHSPDLCVARLGLAMKKGFSTTMEYATSNAGTYKKLNPYLDIKVDPNRHYLSKVNEYATLILPVDLTDDKVYFYLGFGSSQQTLYEWEKDGIKIEAGKSYNIKLKVAEAKKYEVSNYSINNADEFRLASYWGDINDAYSIDGAYSIDSDIDFEGEEIFPIRSTEDYNSILKIKGNKHTLSNFTINMPTFDNVGLSQYGAYFSDLTLKDVTIKGRDNVGAFCGNHMNGTYNNCRLEGNSVINGRNNVGGIIGAGNIASVSECFSAGTIEGTGNNIGGIVGYGRCYANCISTATVKGVENVGGIIGYYLVGSSLGLSQLWHQDGKVSGVDNVGGIAGYLETSSSGIYIDKCLNISEVESTTGYAGGICGGGEHKSITNSYFIGTVTTTSGGVAGGICGKDMAGDLISYCYSAGSIQDENGICGTNSATITDCVTTSSRYAPGNAGTNVGYDYSSKKIVTALEEILNNNSEPAYSTACWPIINGLYDGCPKLTWQDSYQSGTDVPGLGGDISWE